MKRFAKDVTYTVTVDAVDEDDADNKLLVHYEYDDCEYDVVDDSDDWEEIINP